MCVLNDVYISGRPRPTAMIGNSTVNLRTQFSELLNSRSKQKSPKKTQEKDTGSNHVVPVMLTFYDTVCKIVKERSRSRARPSLTTAQTIFWPKKVLAGQLLFDQICFLVGSVSSSLFIPNLSLL